MHHSPRGVRPAAAVALAVGLALLAPGTALAGTTEPTPTTTTPVTTTATTTTSPDPTQTSTTTTADPSTTTESTTGSSTTAPPSSTTVTAPPSSTTSATTSATKSSTALRSAARAAGPTVPFGGPASRLAAVLPGGSPAQAGYAGGFMVRTLAARADHYTYPGGSFPDVGNTIDAVLGLDGAGVGLDQADASYDWLEQNVTGYTGSAFGSLYASSLAKAIIGVVAHGGDPADFGGEDLVAQLESTLGTVTPGRFSDQDNCGDTDPATNCDYSITIGQALALIAVGRATGGVPQEAVDFLLDQQCADGGFRGSLDAQDCTSDVDATSFAAQALVGAGEDGAAADALDFLAARQQANGGLINQDNQVNANTTAVAAQAFAAGGRTSELAAAQAYLATLQLDCSFAAGLRGGIAFTTADYTLLLGDPDNTDAIDRALRATPQSTLALAGGSLLDVAASGSSATVPVLSCPSTTSTTSSSTTTSAPSTSAAVAPAASDPPAASAVPGELAFTGSNVATASVLGLVLLIAGAVLLVLARRKGAHA